MTHKERVIKTLSHQRPDRVPRYDSFWGEFINNWRRDKNLSKEVDIYEYYGIDIRIVVGDETPWPSKEGVLKCGEDWKISRTGWGNVIKTKNYGYFFEVLEYAVKEKKDLDNLIFEDPRKETRFAAFDRQLATLPEGSCIFCKTGGPFLRTSNLRGETQFLMDIVADPSFAKEMIEKVTDHLIEFGLEELRRGNLYDTGVWIFDDIAYNDVTVMSPATYEKLFYPAMKRMCEAFKGAGARFVLFHSDGNIERVLDMLVDAGIDAIQPVEPKAGMNLPKLKRRYGDRLAFIGGMCNAYVLPSGDRKEIKEAVMEILEVASDGGVIIGTHSIGPDISVDTYDYYIGLLEQFGRY